MKFHFSLFKIFTSTALQVEFRRLNIVLDANVRLYIESKILKFY